MKAKTCRYCCYPKEAMASNRTILICSHKEGCEGKFFVVGPDEACGKFQDKNFGRETPPPPRSDGARYIPLTQGKFAIVDAEDYDRLAKYKWCVSQSGNTFYAVRRRRNKTVIMHREIMKAPKSLLVDHKDGNGLKNRKSNLRLCTAYQNVCNRRPRSKSSSKYKGVSWYRRDKIWQVQICYSGKSIHLGRFEDEMEAGVAYDRKAEALFGEFAYLNFRQLVEFRKLVRKLVFSA